MNKSAGPDKKIKNNFVFDIAIIIYTLLILVSKDFKNNKHLKNLLNGFTPSAFFGQYLSRLNKNRLVGVTAE